MEFFILNCLYYNIMLFSVIFGILTELSMMQDCVVIISVHYRNWRDIWVEFRCFILDIKMV